MQKVRFAVRRALEFGAIGFTVFILLNAGAEAVHRPILADRPHLIHPAAHTR